LTIVVVTFVIKDVLRDSQKDLVDSLEATRNASVLKTGIDRLQDNLDTIQYRLQSFGILNLQTTNSRDSILQSIANSKEDLTLTDHRVQNLRETYKLLSQQLRGSDRAKAEQALKRDQATLNDFQRKNAALRSQPTPSSEEQLSNLAKTASDLSHNYWKASEQLFTIQDVLEPFKSECSSAARHLRTFTYLSYLLYPLGILIGIIGQFAGVKPPGRE
jgi:hypothetical protein